jgi:hypothetical protein
MDFGFLQLPVQSVPITDKDASSNPVKARCTRCNKVNIIIVHPRDVVFPEGFSPRENNITRVNKYDVHRKCRQ